MVMKGKKFVVIFLALIIVTAVALSLWIKQGYDTRPAIQIPPGEDSSENHK